MSRTLDKRKQRIFFAVMMLIVAAISAAILELGLRIYYTDTQSSNWTEFHETRGWSLKPGDYWVKPLQRATSFPLKVNQYGLRDLGLPASPPGSPRVIVLGDSFTFAKETRTEKMFTRLLQERLADRRPGVEVFDAGVPGYGTAQQLLLERELHERSKLDGQVYVVAFFTNDILDNLRLSYGNMAPQPLRPGFAVDQNGQAVLQDLPKNEFDAADDTLAEDDSNGGRFKTLSIVKAAAEDWIQTRPTVLRLLGKMGVKTQIARMPAVLNGWYRDDVTTKGVALTAALLRQLQQDVASRGGRLMVTMIPSPFQVYPETYVQLLEKSFPGDPVVAAFASDTERPERLMRQICSDAGIPFQDLLSVFVKNNSRSFYIPRDGHLNDAGHALVGEHLADFLLSHWPDGSETRIESDRAVPAGAVASR